MTQGERVRAIRKSVNLTLEKFGEPLGVGKTAVSKIEHNQVNLTDPMLISICREFNVNEEWLRNGTGNMFRKPSDEVGYYVEDLLEYEGHGNPFYDMIIEMMKNYQDMDEKSKKVIREYFSKVSDGIKEKKEN